MLTPADVGQPAHTLDKRCLNSQPKDKHIAAFEPGRAENSYVPEKFIADAITCDYFPFFSKICFFLSVGLLSSEFCLFMYLFFFSAAGKRAPDTNRTNHVRKRLRFEDCLADQEFTPHLTTRSVDQHLLSSEYVGQGIRDARLGEFHCLHNRMLHPAMRLAYVRIASYYEASYAGLT